MGATPGARAEPETPASTTPARAARRPRALAQAVATAAALLALVAAAYAVGPIALFALVAVVVLAALFELLEALRRSGRRPVAWFGLACGLAVLCAAYAGRAAWLLGALGVSTAGSLLLALRPGRGPAPGADAAWTILGVGWIAGGGAAAVGVLQLDSGGPRLLVAFVLVVAAGDVGAFFVGARLGRRPLAPSLSPAKSWEGFAGGLVSAVAAGGAAGAVLGELSWTGGVGLGVLCGLAGPAGDLVESLAKREIGVKDSSGLLPGHGGFLDRIDAMVFCAPLALAYLWVLAA
jgi:phosphatidate cytidylyltransferase